MTAHESGTDEGQETQRAISAEALKAEVETWANRIRVQPTSVQVRRMTRKWASCSSKGRLTFSEDLLAEAVAVRAEVIVHELLHLKVPNHAKLFHSLLRGYLDAHSPGPIDLPPPF